jgi:hypothetical protein
MKAIKIDVTTLVLLVLTPTVFMMLASIAEAGARSGGL